jgi:hypothetical protein
MPSLLMSQIWLLVEQQGEPEPLDGPVQCGLASHFEASLLHEVVWEDRAKCGGWTRHALRPLRGQSTVSVPAGGSYKIVAHNLDIISETHH